MREFDEEPTSAGEWDRFEARDAGSNKPQQPWILSDRDVWYKNPFYEGPEVPHPEDDEGDYEQERIARERLENDGLTRADIAKQEFIAIQLGRMYDGTDHNDIP